MPRRESVNRQISLLLGAVLAWSGVGGRTLASESTDYAKKNSACIEALKKRGVAFEKIDGPVAAFLAETVEILTDPELKWADALQLTVEERERMGNMTRLLVTGSAKSVQKVLPSSYFPLDTRLRNEAEITIYQFEKILELIQSRLRGDTGQVITLPERVGLGFLASLYRSAYTRPTTDNALDFVAGLRRIQRYEIFPQMASSLYLALSAARLRGPLPLTLKLFYEDLERIYPSSSPHLPVVGPLGLAEKTLSDPALGWAVRLQLNEEDRVWMRDAVDILTGGYSGTKKYQTPHARLFSGASKNPDKVGLSTLVIHQYGELLRMIKTQSQIDPQEKAEIQRLLVRGLLLGLHKYQQRGQYERDLGKFFASSFFASSLTRQLDDRVYFREAFQELNSWGPLSPILKSFALEMGLDPQSQPLQSQPDQNAPPAAVAGQNELLARIESAYNTDDYNPSLSPMERLGRKVIENDLPRLDLAKLPPRLHRDLRIADGTATSAAVLQWVQDFYKKFKKLPARKADLEATSGSKLARPKFQKIAISQFGKILNSKELSQKLKPALKERLNDLLVEETGTSALSPSKTKITPSAVPPKAKSETVEDPPEAQNSKFLQKKRIEGALQSSDVGRVAIGGLFARALYADPQNPQAFEIWVDAYRHLLGTTEQFQELFPPKISLAFSQNVMDRLLQLHRELVQRERHETVLRNELGNRPESIQIKEFLATPDEALESQFRPEITRDMSEARRKKVQEVYRQTRQGLLQAREYLRTHLVDLANGERRGISAGWVSAIRGLGVTDILETPPELRELLESNQRGGLVIENFWRIVQAPQGPAASSVESSLPEASAASAGGKDETPALKLAMTRGSTALKSALSEPGIRMLFAGLVSSPEDLTDALDSLRGHPRLGQVSPQELVREYVGLESESRRASALRFSAAPSTETSSTDQTRRALIQALLSAWSVAPEDPHPLETARDAFIRISRKSFVRDPVALIARLREDRAALGMDPVAQQISKVFDQVILYFEEVLKQQLQGARSQLFAYQKEGVRFLLTHPQAILADDAGLGKTAQALVAFLNSGHQRLLWITTATNRATVVQEALSHTLLRPEQILSFDAQEARRTGFLDRLNRSQLAVVNYEALVALSKSAPEIYRVVCQAFDVMVADEAQFLDNPQTLRSQAVKGVQAKVRWFLSATPYQSKLENLYAVFSFLDPTRFTDPNAFALEYTQSKEGLERLHRLMGQYTLRRTKESTVPEFVPEQQMTFADQLKNGGVRVPHFELKSPDQEGGYQLLPEQQELLAWMTGDFLDFAQYFNRNLSVNGVRIPTDKVTAFQKLSWMQRVFIEPELFGIQKPNPLIEKAKEVVAQRLARGEKVILWAWHHQMLDRLQKEFLAFGVARLDGSTALEERQRAVDSFQNDSATRILVANYGAAGVGLTLTAASTAVFVELPLSYPQFHQAMGRHHRVIGLEQLRHAREHSTVVSLVGRYAPDWVKRVPGQALRAILAQGSLSEQTAQRLAGGRLLYSLVMSGIADESELEALFSRGIQQSLGLQSRSRTKFEPTQKFSRQENPLLAITHAALPLWKLFALQPEKREQLLDWLEEQNIRPQVTQKLLDALGKRPEHAEQIFEWIRKLEGLGNKFLRERAVESVTQALLAADFSAASVSSPVTLAALLAPLGVSTTQLQAVEKDLGRLTPGPERRHLHERWVHALLLAAENRALADLELSLALQAPTVVQERVHRLLSLAMARSVPGNSNRNQMSTAFAAAFGQPATGVFTDTTVQENVLSLWLGYQRSAQRDAQKKLEEAVRAQLAGEFSTWRLDQGRGSSMRLPRDLPSSVLMALQTPLGVQIKLGKMEPLSWRALTEEIMHHPEVRNRVPLLESDLSLEQLESELTRVGHALKSESDPTRKLDLKRDKSQLLFVVSLRRLIEHSEHPTLSADFTREKRTDALTRVRTFLERQGQEPLSEWVGELQTALQREDSLHSREENVVRVSTSAEFTDLLNVGAPSPALLNCFNPFGNPTFNAYVPTVLSTPQSFLIRAHDTQGKLLGQSVVKLKTTQSGQVLVLFIEKELALRPLEDVFAQALIPLAKKLSELSGIKVWIGRAPVSAEERKRDQWVNGTGAGTSWEYVEPLFGLRDSSHVVHRAVWTWIGE